MIRNYLIQSYIGPLSNALIVGHHGSIYMPIFLRTIVTLALIWGCTTLIYSLWGIHLYVQRAATALVIIVYGYFVLRFINDYLDTFIASDRGVTLFRRDGFFHYTVQQFERSKIDMMSFTKTTLSDRIRNTGDVIITLDHDVSFAIECIGNPQSIVQRRRSLKGSAEHPIAEPIENTQSEDKFNILVETLGEVIKDYMGKDKPRLPNQGGSLW